MFQPVIAGLSGVLAAFDAGEDAARSRDDVSAIELEKTAAQRHEGALERGKRRGLAQGRLQLAGGGEVVEPELAQPRLAVEGGADAVALARRLGGGGVVVMATTIAAAAASASRNAQPSVASVPLSIRAEGSALPNFAAKGECIRDSRRHRSGNLAPER